MSSYTKYPRTLHLPWSRSKNNDDKYLRTVDHFIGKEIVVSEKFDGENSSFYSDGTCHARSIDSDNHPSRNWVKQFWAERAYKLPENLRVCGENMFALHSLGYTDLPSYLLGFSVWDGDICLDWNMTLEWFKELDITPVKELYRGVFDRKLLEDMASSWDGTKHEGYVIRLTSQFTYDDFKWSVAKFVRKGHVQTDKHWMSKEITKNLLKH